MIRVDVKPELGIDEALRTFKRLVKKSGILLECSKREYFRTRAEKAKFKQKNKKKKN